MASYTGTTRTAPSRLAGTQHGDGDTPRCVAMPGVNPTPRYFLACFDSGGTRNFWTSFAASQANAPALGGGLTYDVATLTILGRV